MIKYYKLSFKLILYISHLCKLKFLTKKLRIFNFRDMNISEKPWQKNWRQIKITAAY